MYDLLSLCYDQINTSSQSTSSSSRSKQGAGSGIETESLAVCTRLVGAVAAGSSAHLDLATEYMMRADAKFGSSHQEAVDSSRGCSRATVARYGPVSGPLLQLLMDTRAGLAAAEDEEEGEEGV
jgi:hypothetical protein